MRKAAAEEEPEEKVEEEVVEVVVVVVVVEEEGQSAHQLVRGMGLECIYTAALPRWGRRRRRVPVDGPSRRRCGGGACGEGSEADRTPECGDPIPSAETVTAHGPCRRVWFLWPGCVRVRLALCVCIAMFEHSNKFNDSRLISQNTQVH
jgi:hypothetical protein